MRERLGKRECPKCGALEPDNTVTICPKCGAKLPPPFPLPPDKMQATAWKGAPTNAFL